MELTTVLHMNSGAEDTSYATNSLLQRKAISMMMPIAREAIAALYFGSLGGTERLAIADLGCSSGPNTFFAVGELIKVVDKLCEKMGTRPLEYQIFLNDLPQNDFNSVFRCLPSTVPERLRNQRGPCFFTGVPGSFYGRLFPSRTLHFVHSSYSLQWLSQVPRGIEANKGNIFMAITSHQSVLEAYYKQFQDDFAKFLMSRAKELVPGGRMVLTTPGRRSEDRSSSECCSIWELLAIALNEMVSEGLIEEEKLNNFNIPNYMASPEEVKAEVLKEGSFSIDRLETSEVSWVGYGEGDSETGDEGYSMVKCMRAVAEPLLLSHFGEHIIEDVFHRYRLHIADRMSKEKMRFINVIVSLIRKSE